MNKTEHLQLILAFCRQNLALAEKRTHGEWEYFGGLRTYAIRVVSSMRNRVVGCDIDLLPNQAAEGGPIYRGGVWLESDASFIAACAGAAEAGWCATIAAIEGLLLMENISGRISRTAMPELSPIQGLSQNGEDFAGEAIDKIIAAYPLELIQNH